MNTSPDDMSDDTPIFITGTGPQLQDYTSGFTIIDKRVMSGLSLEERGVLGYLLSFPGEMLTTEQILAAHPRDSDDETSAVIASLAAKGLLDTNADATAWTASRNALAELPDGEVAS